MDCICSGSASSNGEAPEACAVRQLLPSSSWCLDETRAFSFGSSRLSNLLIGIVHVSARLESGRQRLKITWIALRFPRQERAHI